MVLERLSWHVTCPNHESFHLFPVARRGSSGSTRKMISLCTQLLSIRQTDKKGVLIDSAYLKTNQIMKVYQGEDRQILTLEVCDLCPVHLQCNAEPWQFPVYDPLVVLSTLKSGHPCPCQDCSQQPPAEKTGRESLLNRPSCPPTIQSIKGLN